MAKHSAFLELALELMRGLPDLRVRAMFGGYGLYQHDTMFGIVIDDRLYLKADASSRGELESKGVAPFSYKRRGRSVTTSYFEAPAEMFEDVALMHATIRKAVGAAATSRGRTREPALPRVRKKPRAAGR